eukprot:948244_1
MSTARKRRARGRKTIGQCKTCWDHGKITAIHPIDYIKNNHIPKQNKPPTRKDRKQKIPHDVIVLKPSQWLPFVHYYPVKDGKVITKPNRSFKKQTKLFSKQSSTSVIVSTRASNPGGRKRDRDTMEENASEESKQIDESHEPPPKRIKLCLQVALDKSKQRNFIPNVVEIERMISGLELNSDNMDQQQLIATQNTIIQSFSMYHALQGTNALDMHALLLREHMNGFAIKKMESLFIHCAYCATFVGSDLCGDWCTGYLITDHDLDNMHRENPVRFKQIKASWRQHQTKKCHKRNMEQRKAAKNESMPIYERETSILVNLFRCVLQMKISRIANWNYPLIVARKYRDGVDVGNQHCERRNTILLVIKSGQNIWQQEGEDEKRDDF